MRRDFIANAAHELRTPLTNLQGYLEALRDGVIVADRSTYESLWDEAERLVRLSRSLDALAEGDAATAPPDRRALDLAAAVRSAVELAQPAIERAGLRAVGRRPGRPCPPGPTPITSPRSSRNLLSNAVRYTPARRRRSPSGPSADPATCSCRSPTAASRSRPTTSTGSSSGSTGSRSRAIGRAAGPASGWRSSSSSSRRAAGGSGPSRPTARRASGSACPALRRRGSPATALSGRADRRRCPARDARPGPTHWTGLSRSPRNATATRIVTAGPNDDARPDEPGRRLLEARSRTR